MSVFNQDLLNRILDLLYCGAFGKSLIDDILLDLFAKLRAIS
jgi:hypothetical protein